jgi:hypothetical protein
VGQKSNETSWPMTIGFVVVVGLTAAFGMGGGDQRQCEKDYETTYVNRGTPYDIGVERYCENVNSGPVDPYGLHS